MPKGHHLTTAAPEFTVPAGSEAPITGEDFVISALPSLGGTVTEAGTGAPGITVTATGPSGTVGTVTGGDGSYAFPGLVDGDYTVTVSRPDGTVPAGPLTRTASVAGANVTGVDFAFARLGSISGATSAAGKPLPGVMLRVDGPGGPETFATDAAGHYDLGVLPAGTYTISAATPKGYRVVGASTRTVTITAAGEAVIGQDFTFEVSGTMVPPTSKPPTTTPAPGGRRPVQPGTGSSGLADTGADANAFPMLGASAAGLLAVGAVLLIARARRPR